MSFQIDLNSYALSKADAQGQCQADPHDHSLQSLQKLCREVGAYIWYENDVPVLRFDPPLERREVNEERWDQAVELEALFWETTER